MMPHPIPPMISPQGRYWDQPSRFSILIDETHALMTPQTFKELKEYSCTLPAGVYEGKMWRGRFNGEWYLVWFGPSDQANQCSVNHRLILIEEGFLSASEFLAAEIAESLSIKAASLPAERRPF